MLHVATYKITWKLKFNGSERESEFGENEKTKIVKRRGKNVSAGEKTVSVGGKKFGRGRKNGVRHRNIPQYSYIGTDLYPGTAR
jgi:hypothetical protein